jgi:tetratricopeptide (TPR) repeat protein
VDQRSVLALIRLGVWHASEGREPEAMGAFQRAVSAEPNAADAWFCLGVVYCGRQMIAESIAAHHRAALAESDNAFYWYALGTMYQRFQPRRWRRDAIAAFQQALRHQRGYPEARAALDEVRDASVLRRMLKTSRRLLRFPLG